MLAYFDCFSGISGKMTLGALIDLGVPVEWLREHMAKLSVDRFDITVSAVARSGVSAKQVEIAGGRPDGITDWPALAAMIRKSGLPSPVIENSLAVFGKIAAAAADVGGKVQDRVSFADLGGTDALVCIIGTALGLDYLKIDAVTASPLPLNRGWADTGGGRMPVPSPAVLAVLTGVPVCGTDRQGETVSPTGAAIVAGLAGDFGAFPEMQLASVGYGAGARNPADGPDLLRIVVGQSAGRTDGLDSDRVCVVETCIDDMNPEFFGFLMERLFADGALDVYWIPVFMKKNRPGTMVQVICPEACRPAVIRRILSETTTSGVRHYGVQRSKLVRAIVTVDTVYGPVPVKRITDPDGRTRAVPEYDVCRKIALEKNLPVRVVYDTVAREANA